MSGTGRVTERVSVGVIDTSLDDKLFEFYQTYDAGETMHSYELIVIDRVISSYPRSVIEFGCNNGKVLKYLKTQTHPTLDILGIDFSITAIKKAHEAGLNVFVGNDKAFDKLPESSVDVIFTCSVLGHIQEIKELVEQMKRVTSNRLIFAETIEKRGEFYFPHNYEELGLKLITSCFNRYNVKYDIWEWRK